MRSVIGADIERSPHINKYLKPAFGRRQLSEIQTDDIQRFVVQVQTGVPNKHNIIRSFRTIWKSAKAWGYDRHNPFEDLILPAMVKSEQRYFTEAELCRILSRPPSRTKLCTGCWRPDGTPHRGGFGPETARNSKKKHGPNQKGTGK